MSGKLTFTPLSIYILVTTIFLFIHTSNLYSLYSIGDSSVGILGLVVPVLLSGWGLVYLSWLGIQILMSAESQFYNTNKVCS